MQFSSVTAVATFAATVLAVWAISRAQIRPGETMPGTAPAALQPVPNAAPDNLRDTNDVRVYQAVKDAVVNITSSHTVTRMVNAGFPGLDAFPPEMLPPELRPRAQQFQYKSLGSGFVIHPAGYIVTNEHVVEQGTDIQCVFVNGDKLAAKVIATDNEHDLAVLKVDPPKPLVALQLGASEDLMIGEPVYAIGNPLGFAGTMTRGIVSALDRTLDVSKDKSYTGLIQTDASINPGNSGGPLLNAYGQVIGVNTAIRADAQGIGFAISVSNMRDLLPAFLNPEALNRAQVGFTMEEVRTIASPSRVSASVIVRKIQSGSALETAGVKIGDRLVAIGKTDVHTIIDALVPIATANPGDTLDLKFTRGAGEGIRTLQATIAVAKPPPAPSADEVITAKMGVKGQTVTADLARRLKLSVAQGVFIDTVVPGSPAAVVGIQPGDVILQIDRYRINTVEELAFLLKSVKNPVSTGIAILRDNNLGRGTIALK
jgi:serine protease Do